VREASTKASAEAAVKAAKTEAEAEAAQIAEEAGAAMEAAVKEAETAAEAEAAAAEIVVNQHKSPEHKIKRRKRQQLAAPACDSASEGR